MNWKKVPLGQVASYITTKVDAIHLNASNYVSADNMEVDRGGITDSAYPLSKGRATRFEKGDILVSNIRPYFKKIWQAKFTGGCSNDVFVLRAKDDIIDPRFLYYTLSRQDFFDFMMAGANGTKMPRGNKKAIPKHLLGLPPLPTQRKIASILSAYDDLIENNLKRIRLLEEKAQLMYEEWFVRMRFPGHEKVKMDEESGLPEGWVRKPFSRIVQINPKTKFSKGVNAPYVPMGSLSESSMVITTVEERPIKGGAKFKNGDTLFARITPCLENGKTGFVQFMKSDDEVASGSTEFIVFRETSELSRYSIYCISRTDEFRELAIKSMVGSDGRQRVQKECFEKFYVSIPPQRITESFDKSVEPKFKLIENLVRQNKALKEARDILLPRLMSGLIDVSDL
tara:strand:+ start:933 stop:2126 length:1194 start_codon:yes stop_codon:yes gene_type:complete